MSLTTSENGCVTLNKARHYACMEATWELSQLAYLLPKVTVNSDIEATNSGLVVRGIAARIAQLSDSLMAGLSDEGETIAKISRTVYVTSLDEDC